MQELFNRLKWFKSNLNADNVTEFVKLIEDIKQKLPESYKLKLDVLIFYEFINDEPLNSLPF